MQLQAELLRLAIEEAINDPVELERLGGEVAKADVSDDERGYLAGLVGQYLADEDRIGISDADLFPEPEED